MKFRLITLFMVCFLFFSAAWGCKTAANRPIGIAVEYNDHAACAYIAEQKGWYEDAGLKVSTIESYVTGMALGAALNRGDIEAAYICLVPAINTYSNAGVPIKIVSGTHHYGYGLVVNPEIVETVADLEKPGVRIGCLQEGGSVDVLLHKIIQNNNLNKNMVIKNIQRMNPSKQILAISMGKLDAAFLPEHWASLAEEYGFTMLIESKDIWSGMQGSVLVVKEDLLYNHPQIVEKLVNVTQQGIDWINGNREASAEMLASALGLKDGEGMPSDLPDSSAQIEITPEALMRSMNRLTYTTSINPHTIQETIDFMSELGYLQKSIRAEELLDLRFIK